MGVLPAQCRQQASVPGRFRSAPWRNPVAEGRTRSHFWPFSPVETNGCQDEMLILYKNISARVETGEERFKNPDIRTNLDDGG